MAALFLGLDSSTQGLTGSLIDLDNRRLLHLERVGYDQDLPRFKTVNGVLPSADPLVSHAPPALWAAALDELFGRMNRRGLPLESIRAVSGSGQQHGSVYLTKDWAAALARMDSFSGLEELTRACLARATAPVWMDSSTATECAEISAAMGGARALAKRTGSAAFERFTGPQIRKFHTDDPQGYERTAHIALVSSLMASLLGGRPAPIDPGDGAGMNLMDIRTRQWCPEALAATAPGLDARLPPIEPSWSVLGPVAPYFHERYGLHPAALAVIWSGDNPCSLVGVGIIRPGQLAISLGTSDTCFGAMDECRTDPAAEGHVFGSPAGGYMSLLCFRNGSLARERVRDAHGLDWEGFEQALRDTPPGNEGALMLPWFEPEIIPRVTTGGARSRGLERRGPAAECRAVVEGQMLAMRLHSAWMGRRPDRIYATGGASRNREILQVMADVNGCPVYRSEVPESAALGAALRAAHAWLLHDGDERPWADIIAGFTDPLPGSEIRPRADAAAVYDRKLEDYAAFEREALA